MQLYQRTILLLLILTGIKSLALAQRQDDPQRDSQIWPDVITTITLDEKNSLVLFGTLRLGRDDSALVNKQLGVGLNRLLNKNFSTAFQYRFIKNEPTPNRLSTEHRLHVDLTTRTSLKLGFNLSDRNRFEWRDINGRISWRFRNRLQFERPFSIGERRLTPYISGETMYDTRFDTWTRNQLYIGARVPIAKHLTLDGFYMRQWDARTQPGFLNVIGSFIRLDF
jgi:hypothetical protein